MPSIRQMVQPGTVAKLRIEIVTGPSETGRTGGFVLREAMIDVDGVTTNLTSWTMPVMVERAFKLSGAETASVTASPSFSAGAGPIGEDVWDITVDSTVGFTVGDFIRAAVQPDNQGQVYRVLSIPDGTSLIVHGKISGCDIVNGDTVEEVTPTGIYTGAFDFVVDDFLDSGSTTGSLRVIAQTVDTGDAPAFDTVVTAVWNFDLQLDIGSRQYRVG